MTEHTWESGERCQVSIPFGVDGRTVLPGHVARVQEPGPYKTYRTIKVIFDDPLVFGGNGMGWFSPAVVTPEGSEPAAPERMESAVDTDKL